MSADADTVHAALAAGATDAADLVVRHADAPPLAGLDIDYHHVTDMPVIRAMLAGHDLTGLMTWSKLLSGQQVDVLRAPEPFTHTSVRLHATVGGSELIVAVHPGQAQLDALWAAAGGRPDRGVTTRIAVTTVAEAVDSSDIDCDAHTLAAALAGDVVTS